MTKRIIIFIVPLFFIGCASHLEKGWRDFGEGKYYQAHETWAKETEKPLSEQMEKAEAAAEIAKLHRQLNSAESSGNFREIIKYSLFIIEKDRWENKDWLEKKPILKEYLDQAHLKIEDSYFRIMEKHKTEENWSELKRIYGEYTIYTVNYHKSPSERIKEINNYAIENLEKIARNQERISKIKSDYDNKLNCSRNQILSENFESALKCLNDAEEINKDFPDISINTNERDYLLQVIERSINQRNTQNDHQKKIREFNQQLDCGKNKFLEDDFDGAKACLAIAKNMIKENPTVSFAVNDLNFLYQTIDQGINLKLNLRIKDFNAELDCGKKKFLEDDFDGAFLCLVRAKNFVEKYPDISFNVSELEYVRQSTEQGRKIKHTLDEELRLSEIENKKLEEENRKLNEAKIKLEKEHRIQEDEKIRQAQGSEKEALRKIEEKRRKDIEEKQKKEEENKKWKAFLKEGLPLTPIVTTVLKPSEGIGSLEKGKEQNWQGGSQLPEPEDKSIPVEDVYALEIEIPKTHKLNYLKSVFQEQENKPGSNLLSPPNTDKFKRRYYTEKFKGGRYYLEIINEGSDENDYEIKSRIYKIPVILK